MKKEVLGICPISEGETKVTKIKCQRCGTTIEGSFDLCKFCMLSKESKYFAEVFIKNRGNIKEIEKELGISYPTVRNKLEELIRALGYVVDETPKVNKKEILDKVSSGDITAEEAIKLLK